jgi:hypothetical protein
MKSLSALRNAFGGHAIKKPTAETPFPPLRNPMADKLKVRVKTGHVAGIDVARVPMPHAFVLFGGGGDLAKRKIIPALYNLERQGLLPPRFAILGVGGNLGSDADYRAVMKEASVSEFSRTRPSTTRRGRASSRSCTPSAATSPRRRSTPA